MLGLIMRKEYIIDILEGRTTIDTRLYSSEVRGKIGLIESNTDLLYGFVTETQVVALVESLAERVVPGRIPKKNLDAWACDVIGHYWRKISATPDRTKSTPFLRLMSDLNYDNDGVISKQTQWESKN